MEVKYFITTNTHLAAALITCGQNMTYNRSGKIVYFHFVDSAILRDLVERYEYETLHDGIISKHEQAMYTVNKILKGKI